MTFEEYEQQFQSSSYEEWIQKVTQATKEMTETLAEQGKQVNHMLQKRNEYESLWKQEKKKCGVIAKIFKKDDAARAAKQAQEYFEKFELFRDAFLREYEKQEEITKEAISLQNYMKFASAMYKS